MLPAIPARTVRSRWRRHWQKSRFCTKTDGRASMAPRGASRGHPVRATVRRRRRPRLAGSLSTTLLTHTLERNSPVSLSGPTARCCCFTGGMRRPITPSLVCMSAAPAAGRTVTDLATDTESGFCQLGKRISHQERQWHTNDDAHHCGSSAGKHGQAMVAAAGLRYADPGEDLAGRSARTHGMDVD